MSGEVKILLMLFLVISKLDENNATLQEKEKTVLEKYSLSMQQNQEQTSPEPKDKQQINQQFYKKGKHLHPNADMYSKILNYDADDKMSMFCYLHDSLKIKKLLNDLKILKINDKTDSYVRPDTYYQNSLIEKAMIDLSVKNGYFPKDNYLDVKEFGEEDLKNGQDTKDKNPLWYAVKSKQWSTVATLIRSGIKVTKEIIDLENWSDIFKEENDIKNKFFNSYLKLDEDGYKLLLLSIVKSNYSLTKFLIDCGVNLKLSKNGNSHIWLLLSRGNFELVDYMISNGADIKIEDKLGLTLLHKAALLDERKAILEFLLSRGLDVNIKGKLGLTPLDISNGGAWSYLRERGGKTSRELKEI